MAEQDEITEVTEEEAEDVEEESPETETQEQEEAGPKTFDELKVVIIMKNESLMVGVQSPDCDPVYETFKGTLAAALKKVPKIVDKAKQQWTERPKYPKADLPTPPVTTTTTAGRSSAKENKKQPSFF